MYVFIALNEKLQCHHDTIKSCIVLTNFEKQKFLAEYYLLKPLIKKISCKVIKNMEILFTLALYCT